MAEQKRGGRKPAWAQTHASKPKRYDRRHRRAVRAAKGA